MEITGESLVRAPCEQVWVALNDPDVLQQTIPGCESLEKHDDNEYRAKIQAKIGPVKAGFNVRVSLENLDPPNGYTLSGEGQGGMSGFARGSADVELIEQGAAATLVRYTARFQVGGKLAQVGSRLVTGATRKTAEQFFANFAAYFESPPGQAESESES